MESCREKGHIYYYELEGDFCFLTDELDKRKLLNHLRDAWDGSGIRIYAFCLTDQEIYLLLEAQGKVQADSLVKELDRRYAGEQFRRHGRNRICVRSTSRIRGVDALCGICRQIHRIPEEQGYVTSLKDYWWSSYRSYVYRKEWEFLDTEPILDLFGGEKEKPLAGFRRFHALLP